MNVDNSASSGLTKTDDSKSTTKQTDIPQTASTSPNNAISELRAPDAPTISVSPPGGGQVLRFDHPFRAAHTAYHKSKPHPESDLIKQYGLEGLEASVARVDPKTGEKINRLRKSYEGQIKSFGLAGKNKAIPHNKETDGLSLLQLAQWPGEEFSVQRVFGKEVEKGLSDGIKQKLERAMELKPGKVPRNAEWENALGLVDKKGVSEDSKGKKQEVRREEAQQTANQPTVNGHINGFTSVPEARRSARPKKRKIWSPDEVYGEEYDDDEDDDRSSNDGSRRSSNSRKKQRKSSSNNMSGLQAGGYSVGLSQQAQLSRGISSYVSR